MSTIENNKIIAKFMEYPDLGTAGDFSYLKYHTSWDWLMPVVEKIETLQLEIAPSFSQNSFAVIISTPNTVITSGDLMGDLPMFNRHSGTKLEATYKAVVEFIKWYNQNQNKDE